LFETVSNQSGLNMSILHDAVLDNDLSLVKELVSEDRSELTERDRVSIDILLFYIFHLVMRDWNLFSVSRWFDRNRPLVVINFSLLPCFPSVIPLRMAASPSTLLSRRVIWKLFFFYRSVILPLSWKALRYVGLYLILFWFFVCNCSCRVTLSIFFASVVLFFQCCSLMSFLHLSMASFPSTLLPVEVIWK